MTTRKRLHPDPDKEPLINVGEEDDEESLPPRKKVALHLLPSF